MNVNDALVTALRSAEQMMLMLTGDLTDGDLLVRPVPGANHLAWQLGHLISAEHRFLVSMGYPAPPLPEGFQERHGSQAAADEQPESFFGIDVYREAYKAQRAAAIEAASKATPEELDRPNNGPVAAIAPTVGAVFLLMAAHSNMHLGQASVVRRKQGLRVMF